MQAHLVDLIEQLLSGEPVSHFPLADALMEAGWTPSGGWPQWTSYSDALWFKLTPEARQRRLLGGLLACPWSDERIQRLACDVVEQLAAALPDAWAAEEALFQCWWGLPAPLFDAVAFVGAATQAKRHHLAGRHPGALAAIQEIAWEHAHRATLAGLCGWLCAGEPGPTAPLAWQVRARRQLAAFRPTAPYARPEQAWADALFRAWTDRPPGVLPAERGADELGLQAIGTRAERLPLAWSALLEAAVWHGMDPARIPVAASWVVLKEGLMRWPESKPVAPLLRVIARQHLDG